MWHVLLGTVLYVLAFPRYDLWPLAFAVLPFWLWGMEKLHTVKQALLAALLSGALIALGGFHWIAYVIREFGGFPIAFAVLCLLLFSLIAAPQLYVFFGLAVARRDRLKRWPVLARIFFWPTFYAAAEFLVRFVKIFPEHLGNTQVHWLGFAQNAAWGGASALTFLTLLPGSWAYHAWREPAARRPRIALVPLLLFVTSVAAGHLALHRAAQLPVRKISATVVQGNIGNMEKLVSESGDINAIQKVLDVYTGLMAKAGKPHLLIWPETAYPIAYPTGEETRVGPVSTRFAEFLQAAAKKSQTNILFGGYESIRGEHDFNSAILLDSKGATQGYYRKFHLLIFGEYMPLSGWFPVLKKLNPQVGGFDQGPGPLPIHWSPDGTPAPIGANICYEALLPEYMRALAKNGAAFFVNLTNDSWFGPGFEPYQHWQLAVLRTIETRTPMIRATNTGITSFMDHTGRILASGPLFEPALITAELPLLLTPPVTLYRLWGEAFAWACVFLSLLLLLNFRSRPAEE